MCVYTYIKYFFDIDGGSHYSQASQVHNIIVQNILLALWTRIPQPPGPFACVVNYKRCNLVNHAIRFLINMPDRHCSCKMKHWPDIMEQWISHELIRYHSNPINYSGRVILNKNPLNSYQAQRIPIQATWSLVLETEVSKMCKNDFWKVIISMKMIFENSNYFHASFAILWWHLATQIRSWRWSYIIDNLYHRKI